MIYKFNLEDNQVVRQKGFVSILIVLIVILFFGLGYITSKYYSETLRSTPPNTSSSLSSTKPTANPFDVWRLKISSTNVIFTNTKENISYSFGIPKGWSTELRCNGGLQGDKYICLKSPDLVQNAVPVVEKGQLVAIAMPGSSFFLGGYSQNPSDFCKKNDMYRFTCKESTLNGQKIIKKVYQTFSFIDVAIIGADNQISLTIRLEYSYPTGYKGNEFDQILSSFKLTR